MMSWICETLAAMGYPHLSHPPTTHIPGGLANGPFMSMPATVSILFLLVPTGVYKKGNIMSRFINVCGLCMVAFVTMVCFGEGLHADATVALDTPLVRRGAEIFVENCSTCHYADKTETKIGPGFKGLFQRDRLPFKKVPVTEDAIVSQLRFPFKKMPRFMSLTQQQIRALTAYLKTL